MMLSVIIDLIYLMCNKNGNKNRNKNDRNKKRYIRYVCYHCNLGINKGKDLYFALDMVYCSEECRYNYLISRDYDTINIV